MSYRPEIDGLRAVAVLPVILFHAGITSGGLIGVDIFFVISGYLITGILLESMQKNNFSLLEFYERRARRILPALIVIMLACIPLARLLMPPEALIDFGQSLSAIILFFSNIFFWCKINLLAQDIKYMPLVHTWSIGIEEQFYLLFPLLVCGLWGYIKKYLLSIFIILFICSIIFSEIININYRLASYYLLSSRLWELMFGAILAHSEFKYGRNNDQILNSLLPSLGLCLIAISVVTFMEGLPHPGFITLIPVIGSGLIIWFGGQNDLGTWILCSKPFVGLGLISYSVYLLHQPILVFMRLANKHDLSKIDLLIYVILTIAIGYFCWRYIEQPFRNPKIIKRPKFLLSMGLSSVIILTSGLLYAS